MITLYGDHVIKLDSGPRTLLLLSISNSVAKHHHRRSRPTGWQVPKGDSSVQTGLKPEQARNSIFWVRLPSRGPLEFRISGTGFMGSGIKFLFYNI